MKSLRQIKSEITTKTSILTMGTDTRSELERYNKLIDNAAERVYYGLVSKDEAVKHIRENA